MKSNPPEETSSTTDYSMLPQRNACYSRLASLSNPPPGANEDQWFDFSVFPEAANFFLPPQHSLPIPDEGTP